jgi:hypothetical protein
MTQPAWLQARAIANEAARAAGAAALPWFRRSDLTVESKADASPVSGEAPEE